MPVIQALKVSLAVAFSVLGFVGLSIMVNAELETASQFEQYFRWAIGGGLVFLAIGASLVAYERDDTVLTQFGDEKSKR